VTRSAQRVLEAVCNQQTHVYEFGEYPVGGAAIDLTGSPLPDETLSACLQADAVFLGAVGGPAWDEQPSGSRPESGLLKLRKELDVYCNLRPVVVDDSMSAASPIKSDRVAGADFLIVRELTGGLYFGEPRSLGRKEAYNTLRYNVKEVERIARIGFESARSRRGHVTSVDKANVLEVSVLWRDIVTKMQRDEFPDVKLSHMYVDNAAMQIVLNPRQFDVILTGNLFGDILSDLGATLPGSVGVLPSASIGGTVGVFEPVHGSAPDLAGTDTVNPIAAILSSAMLLEHIGEHEQASRVRAAVSRTLETNLRTADMLIPGIDPVGTSAFTEAVLSKMTITESTESGKRILQ
jgi:3-isopropylmalate dehydrogenase